MLPDLLSKLAATGLLGLIAALAVALFIWKDRQLEKERAARVEDAKAYTQMTLTLQSQVLDAVRKLSDIFDELREQRRRRP